jgi:hypothetical protein
MGVFDWPCAQPCDCSVSTYAWMRILESAPQRYDFGIRLLSQNQGGDQTENEGGPLLFLVSVGQGRVHRTFDFSHTISRSTQQRRLEFLSAFRKRVRLAETSRRT